jgi:hypothetical protein
LSNILAEDLSFDLICFYLKMKFSRELLDLGICKDFHLLADNTLPFQKLEDLVAA